MIIQMFFFFYWCGLHPVLHSFPTRRSSDLVLLLGGVDHAERRCSTARSSARHVASRSSNARSEEHTSELQSRGHLVCRLLLEKKKTRRWFFGLVARPRVSRWIWLL